jgi:hypothetical protein
MRGCVLFLVCSVFVMEGCGESEVEKAVEGPVGTCSVRVGDTTQCVEYVGSAWERDLVEEACDAQPNGNYRLSACSSAGRSGSCSLGNATFGPNRETVVHFYAPTTLEAAKAACSTLRGAFTGGPEAACVGADGQTVSNGAGEVRVRYEFAEAPFGEECVEEVQERICESGEFSEWTGEFDELGCVEDEGACDGVAQTCASLDAAACGGQLGCATVSGECVHGTPGSAAYNCANFTSHVGGASNCNAIPGCSWNYGASTCDGGVQYC